MEAIAEMEEMKIFTQQFGELTVKPEHVFEFEEGLLGFEDLRQFVLISEEETLPFRWLVSLENPDIGFPLLSPWHIDLRYNPGKEHDMSREVIMVVITLEDEKGLMTANMKAPLILDVKSQSGRQVILPSDKYSPSYVIPRK